MLRGKDVISHQLKMIIQELPFIIRTLRSEVMANQMPDKIASSIPRAAGAEYRNHH